MKTILGLDLGTNSIGWATIIHHNSENSGQIVGAGSRIIPMSQDILGKFDSGVSISQTAERTGFRGIRRLRERHLLRRERLHRVLHVLGFLPSHYDQQINFDDRPGQFLPDKEPKLPYIFNPVTEKSEFIFKSSFEEMLADFAKYQPILLEGGKKVPHDWTIYYLRKKALHQKIEQEELAWLLLHFNQKRGYYQLRGEEEEENPGKLIEFHRLMVADVQADEPQRGKDDIWYSIILENGWIYRRSSKVPLFDWKGKQKEFIVTTDLNEDNTVKTDKEGKEKRSFKAVDSEKDWTAIKKSTEEKIERSEKTVGLYIYDHLLKNPNQKIKGKLVRVIERKFYRSELEAILKVQQDFHPKLRDLKLYESCLLELYENNEAHRNSIGKKDFTHLFLNDIIFYQRPLKSKKSLISNCKFETRIFIKDGKKEIQPLKCIAKSHPLFQEFRLWQWLQNLRIFEKGSDKEVTDEILKTEEDWSDLFNWLNNRKEVDHKALFNYLLKPLKLKPANFRWNYVYDEVQDISKSYPCNETRAQIQLRLARTGNVSPGFLSKETEENLWHILYSVEDKIDIEKALRTFADKNGLGEDFIDNFSKFPPFKKDYGAYSAKAIKKLLPLMRLGRYWNENNIHEETRGRIENLLTGEYDEQIRNRVREKSIHLHQIDDFKGLPQWLSSYIVYDRHSEDGEAVKWNTPAKIKMLDQHSLRNPIVEQVINETLKVVRDIWLKYGAGKEDFFDEIHIELGRELKNPSDKRREMTNKNTENENTNLRIKALLRELQSDGTVENVRPYSPMQQEILKIYEEGVLNAEEGNIPDDIVKISKQAQPTSSEILKYTLWLQQKYRSPYTGAIIPLQKLFTREYDIEHIIPQSRYFDDSLSNKVICETVVNSDKGNLLGYEYINRNYGKMIPLGNGKYVPLFSVEAYESFVKDTYSKSRTKMKKLLMEEIPEAYIQRQLNDTRYISKVVKNLLSNIVREEGEQEMISKKVIVCTGSITSILRQDWGLNNVWNEMITPRFERLNTLTSSTDFGEWTNKEGKRVFQTQVPIALQKGFKKKRIDHRHHALDAIVIACATRNHINYLNNENALGKTTKEEKDKKRYDLKHTLCTKKYNDEARQNYKWIFNKPWRTFTQDTRDQLLNIIISFKQNIRVINKTVNQYQAWRKDENGCLKKDFVKQTKGVNWAVRKPLHKDTVSGLVQLRFKKEVSLAIALDHIDMLVDKNLKEKIKELAAKQYDKKSLLKFFKDLGNQWNDKDITKPEIFYFQENVATRVKVDESFNRKKIESITDTGIQKILLSHLKKFDDDKNGKLKEQPELAFSAEGLEEMNRTIIELNEGKPHQPIFRVRTFEPKGNKFNIGQTGNKKDKFVEAAKGTNLFFGIYVDEKGKRYYETIPLNIIIERQKQGLSAVPDKNDDGKALLFYLSPNDLVYVPEEIVEDDKKNFTISSIAKPQVNRIYKVVSFSGSQCFFLRNDIATSIAYKFEFSPLNKMERSLDGAMIKDICTKLNVDRLGNIIQQKVSKNIAPFPNLENQLNEPLSVYKAENSTIAFPFTKIRPSSFEKQEEENREFTLELNPIQRLSYLRILIENAYGRAFLEIKDLKRKINQS